MSTELRQRLEEAVAAAESYSELESAVQAHVQKLQQEAGRAQAEPLSSPIGTFAGEGTTVPGYVATLLSAMSQIKVLYRQERRESIGRREASRLLALKVTRGGPEVLRDIQDTVNAVKGREGHKGKDTKSLFRGTIKASIA